MTAEQTAGLIITLMVMAIGLIGSVVPALPSTPVVLVAAIGHKVYFGDTGAGWFVMTLLVLLTVISLILDHLASAYGAKRFGATWKGIVGAIVGGIVGIFFSIPGMILGPFIGAALFELLGRRSLRDSGKAGVGAVLGLVLGVVGKLASCVAMMILFAMNVLGRSGGL